MKRWTLVNVRGMMTHHPGLAPEHLEAGGGGVVQARGGRDGAEGLGGLQGRVQSVLVLARYWGAHNGLSADGVGQDRRWRGISRGGHHLLQSLAGAVLVSHEVRTEACNG